MIYKAPKSQKESGRKIHGLNLPYGVTIQP